MKSPVHLFALKLLVPRLTLSTKRLSARPSSRNLLVVIGVASSETTRSPRLLLTSQRSPLVRFPAEKCPQRPCPTGTCLLERHQASRPSRFPVKRRGVVACRSSVLTGLHVRIREFWHLLMASPMALTVSLRCRSSGHLQIWRQILSSEWAERRSYCFRLDSRRGSALVAPLETTSAARGTAGCRIRPTSSCLPWIQSLRVRMRSRTMTRQQ
jgi:hypothetical protein